MKDIILAIVLAAIGSSGLFGFIQFLMKRRDDKKGSVKHLEEMIDSQKRDNVRIQLLILMSLYPDDIQEIFRLAQTYFVELDGNWYMSTMFVNWLKEKNLPKPDWFRH